MIPIASEKYEQAIELYKKKRLRQATAVYEHLLRYIQIIKRTVQTLLSCMSRWECKTMHRGMQIHS